MKTKYLSKIIWEIIVKSEKIKNKKKELKFFLRKVKYLTEFKDFFILNFSFSVIFGILFLGFFYLIKIIIIDPLLPFWNLANNQTRATLVLGNIIGLIEALIIQVILYFLKKFNQKKNLNNFS